MLAIRSSDAPIGVAAVAGAGAGAGAGAVAAALVSAACRRTLHGLGEELTSSEVADLPLLSRLCNQLPLLPGKVATDADVLLPVFFSSVEDRCLVSCLK